MRIQSIFGDPGTYTFTSISGIYAREDKTYPGFHYYPMSSSYTYLNGRKQCKVTVTCGKRNEDGVVLAGIWYPSKTYSAALLREDVWEACRKGTLSNFDPSRGHVMPRIYTYWRFTMYGEIRKAQRRQTVSLDTLTMCPSRLVVQPEDMVEISQALQRFRLYRPMDYAIIAALMDGVDKEQLAGRLGRREYDAIARQRVCGARKAFGKVLYG